MRNKKVKPSYDFSRLSNLFSNPDMVEDVPSARSASSKVESKKSPQKASSFRTPYHSSSHLTWFYVLFIFFSDIRN